MDKNTYENIIESEGLKEYYIDADVPSILFHDTTVTVEGTVLTSAPITEDVKNAICRYVGMSASLAKYLSGQDQSFWKEALTRLYKYKDKESITLLVQEDSTGFRVVKNVTMSDRQPMTNVNFIDRVYEYFSTSESLEIADIVYDSSSIESYVVLRVLGLTPMDGGDRSWTLGFVFRGDETGGISCRLAIVPSEGSDIIYLPAKMYNLTSTRYDKTTHCTEESLDMLMLRVLEDVELNETFLEDKWAEVLARKVVLKETEISLLEFTQLRNTISNACYMSNMSEEEVSQVLEKIEEFDDYNKIYGDLKSDYLWRCTAFSNHNFTEILEMVGNITSSHVFYPQALSQIRYLLGEYVMLPRLHSMVAHPSVALLFGSDENA